MENEKGSIYNINGHGNDVVAKNGLVFGGCRAAADSGNMVTPSIQAMSFT